MPHAPPLENYNRLVSRKLQLLADDQTKVPKNDHHSRQVEMNFDVRIYKT